MKPASHSIRFSNLKLMAKSPAHYKCALETEQPDTATFRNGRLAHRLLLNIGPELIVWEGRRQGKLWEGFKEEHEGAEIVSRKEYDNAEAMRLSFNATPEAVELSRGPKETTLRWKRADRQCQGTPDVILPGVGIVDLKTCDDASIFRFPNVAIRYGYHAQLSWYLDGATSSHLDCENRTARSRYRKHLARFRQNVPAT